MLNKQKSLFKKVFLSVIILVVLVLIVKFKYILENSYRTLKDNGSIMGVSIEKISDDRLEALVEGDPIDISEIPLDRIVEDKYQRLFYIKDNLKKKVTQNSHLITQFQFSPSKNQFGYLENSNVSDESVPWDKQVVLYIGETYNKKTKEVYHGSHKTSGWEWFSENEILIPYGCGTECEVLYLVDANSGFKETIQQGVGYEWSSDKNWLFAYRYSGKLGIIAFNRNQDKIYEYLKDPDHRMKYYEEIKGEWAPSSNRLAMIKEKDNEDQLELIIVDFDKDGKVLLQKNLGEVGCANMWWDSNREFTCYHSQKGRLKFRISGL